MAGGARPDRLFRIEAKPLGRLECLVATRKGAVLPLHGRGQLLRQVGNGGDLGRILSGGVTVQPRL